MVRNSVILALLLLVVANLVAQQTGSPREQLNQYVSDLQKNPSDDALREKIIKLALTVTPKPAIPPEADEKAGRGQYLVEHGTSDADLETAASAFWDAATLAPWEPAYYYKQGVALEGAKRFDKAIAAFKWYLMAKPDADNVSDVRQKIGGLKVASEKAAQEAAQQAAEQARKDQEAAAAQRHVDDIQRLLNSVRGRTGGYYRQRICNYISAEDAIRRDNGPVSYTHLTLPTICSV